MGTRSSASKPGGRGYERGHRECQREDESMEKNLAVDVRPLHVATVRSLVEPTPRGREGNARRPRDFKRCIGPKKSRPQRAEGFHEVAHQRARDTWGLGLGLVRRSLSSGPCLGKSGGLLLGNADGREAWKNLLRPIDFSGRDWERARRRICKHGVNMPLAPVIGCSCPVGARQVSRRLLALVHSSAGESEAPNSRW